MKIRIKGNFLRFRLTRQETARLAAEGRVENQTEIGGQVFRYAVETRSDVKAVAALLEPFQIRIVAPATAVESWASTDTVGFYAEQPTSGDGHLNIAVEKDFRCLDPRRDEDESDQYDNPLATQSQHLACAQENE